LKEYPVPKKTEHPFLNRKNQKKYMKNALIIHGTEGYPKENWFPWLKKEIVLLIKQSPTWN